MKLKGIRIVDLSQFLPGPHLSMMMADHGAEVIKVEIPGSGDPTRHIGPRQGDHTVYFRNTNRGKRSLTLDLKSSLGREALLRLLQTADACLETFRPGVAARLGIDYASVRKVAPRLVYCSISAFGQDGPLRLQPAHDLSVQAQAGALSLAQRGDEPPGIPAVPAADMAASLMALSGILMGILRARESGEGDYLDIAMHDALAAWLLHGTGSLFAEGRPIEPANDRLLGGAAFYNLYRTADDRYLSLGGSEPKFVETLLTALGRPDLIALGRAPAGPAQAPLRAFLAETFRGRTLAEWVAWFAGRDVCFAPVLDLKEALDGEAVRARDMLLRDAAGNRHLGVPIKFAGEPARPRLDCPALGEANAEILGGLGFSAEEVRLLSAG